jgi:lipopolysaccharide export system protein LptC
MDIWGPRQAASLRDARTRTALVHIIRLLFTVGAVLAAGLLIGPAIQHAISAGAPKYSAPALSETMLHPQFEGRDADNKLYIVTADTARRRRDNVQLVDLVNPRLANKSSTSVQAKAGVYDREQEILDLQGDVVMDDAAGYRFTADSSRMYLKDNRVEGRTQLHGVGPIGEVRADSYEVRGDGDVIVLRGDVWTKFNPRGRKRSGGG